MSDFKVVAKLMADVSDFKSGLSSATSALVSLKKTTGSSMERVGKTVAATGSGLTKAFTLPLAAISGFSLKTASDFEAGMSKVQAISGASGEDMERLGVLAQEMGATTKFSALEAADGLSYMAMAGWTTDQMIAGLPGVMNLAAASGEDLALVSDIVTDSLSAFGLEAKDSAKFADILAAAASSSNTNVSMMGESFKYAAPIAGTLGYNAEDTAVALGLMANRGIKASQAGTTLRSAFSRLADPTEEVASGLEMVGLRAEDLHGLTLDQTLKKFREGFADLDSTQKAQAASMIFGKNAMSGMLGIINASEKEYNDLSKAIYNSKGAAEKMSEVMLDNLNGSLTLLKSAIEGAAISIGNILMPYVKKMVDGIRGAVDWFNNLSQEKKELIVRIGLVVAAIGPLLFILGNTLIWFSKVGAAVKGFGLILKGLGGILGGVTKLFGVFKAVGLFVFGALKSAALGLIGVIGSITAPVWAIIAVITVLTATVLYLWNTNETFRQGVADIWNAIVNVVSGAIDVIIGWLQSFGDWLGTLLSLIADGDWSGAWEMVKTAAVNVWNAIISFIESAWEAIKSAVKFGVEALPDILTAAGGLIESAWNAMWNVIKEVASAVWDTIKSVVRTGIEAIPTIIEGTGEMLKVVWNAIWNGFLTIVNDVWELIKEAVSTSIESIGPIISGAWESVKAIWDESWNQLKESVTKIFENLLETIGSWVTNIGEKLAPIGEFFSNAWNGASQIVDGAMTFMGDVTKSGIDTVTSWFSWGNNDVSQNALNMANNVESASSVVPNSATHYKNFAEESTMSIQNMTSPIMGDLANITSGAETEGQAIEATKKYYQNLSAQSEKSVAQMAIKLLHRWEQLSQLTKSKVDGMSESVVNKFQTMKSRLDSVMSNVVQSIQSAMNKAVSAMNNASGQARTAGYNMGVGFYNGLSSMSGSIISLAQSIADRAAAVMRAALQIHSPSRVTTKIGEFFGEGLYDGIGNMIKPVSKIAEKLANTGVDILNGGSVAEGLASFVSGDLQSQVSLSNGTLTVNQRPLDLTINLGGRTFRKHVEDINHMQSAMADLDDY